MTINLSDLGQNDLKSSYLYCLKRLLPFAKPYKFRAIFAVLISIPVGIIEGSTAFLLKPFIDSLNSGIDMRFVIGVPIAVIMFSVVQGILSYLSAYHNNWVGSKITLDIQKVMFKKLLNYESSFYDKNSTGLIISRFSGDANAASAGLITNIKQFLTRSFSAISLTCVLLYNSWQLAIIAISILACAFIPLAFLRRKLKSLSEENVKIGGVLFTVYNETCSGNRTVAAYNLQKQQADKFNYALNYSFKVGIKSIQSLALVSPLMQLITSVGVATVVGYSAYLIKIHQMTTGNFVSFVASLILLYQPLKALGDTYSQAQASIFATGRILELLDSDSAIKNKENAVKLHEIKNTISFENVTFEYDKNKPVLKNINLEVKIGETLALVGNSGGGKSSFVGLIPRFYDVLNGAIKIDGIDVRDMTLESLRDNIAVVFQDNFLFEGTIRENILLGKPSATEEELNETVKNAYLEDFIKSLEKGLDTVVGERGVLLSGGQKQRVAIARALIKNTPIIILDEATSALDNKSEAVVQQAIENLMQNRTVFVIAHRLSTIKNATRIAVIDDGQIVEIGKHEELLEIEHGVYRNLYMTQFKTKNEDESVALI